ncbi:MAG: hypothetical protein ACJ746_25085 [Bryobacteraceae bacterium]
MAIDLSPIISATIAGIFAVVVALIQTGKLSFEKGKLKLLSSHLSVAALGVLCGLFLSQISRPAADVKISYPFDGASIEIPVTIHGTSRNIPSDRSLYVVLFSQSKNRFYPETTPAQVQPNGDWYYLANVGANEPPRSVFTLIAVLADAKAKKAFAAASVSTAAHELEFERMPDGLTEYSRVTVNTK